MGPHHFKITPSWWVGGLEGPLEAHSRSKTCSSKLFLSFFWNCIYFPIVLFHSDFFDLICLGFSLTQYQHFFCLTSEVCKMNDVHTCTYSSSHVLTHVLTSYSSTWVLLRHTCTCSSTHVLTHVLNELTPLHFLQYITSHSSTHVLTIALNVLTVVQVYSHLYWQATRQTLCNKRRCYHLNITECTFLVLTLVTSAVLVVTHQAPVCCY